MAYDANTAAALDVTKPDGSVEYPSILDDALREVKRAVKNDLEARLAAAEEDIDEIELSITTMNNPSPAYVELGSNLALGTSHGNIPGMSMSLGAGTWQIFGQITVFSSGASVSATFRLLNGAVTVTYAMAHLTDIGKYLTVPIIAQITLTGTTTIQLQGMSASGITVIGSASTRLLAHKVWS